MAAKEQKFLDYNGLVKYTGLVKKAIGDGQYTHAVTNIAGDTTTPSYDSDVNATAATRNATYTNNGSNTTFPYKDTTYGQASTSKDGLMSHEDKTKLNGIEAGAQVNPTIDSAMSTTSTNAVQNKVAKAAIDAAAKTVRQTSQTGSTALPLLTAVSGTPTSGNNAEAGYDTDLKYTPSTDTLTIKTPTASVSGTTITPTQITIGTTATGGSGTLTKDHYSGHADATETALASTTSGSEGAGMVGYSGSDTVKDAIDDIYGIIGGGGGGGGDSIIDRVDVLEGDVADLQTNKASKSDAVGSITGTSGGNETGSYAKVNGTTATFSYNNNKVAQGSTTAAGTLPLLLAGSATPTGAADVAKFNANIYASPSTGEITLKNPNTQSTYVTFAPDGIQWRKQSGTGQMSLTFDGGFSGNSATATLATNATNDGQGRNIANTYALKSEVINPVPVILDELPTTQSEIEALTGKFVFVLDGGASTDTRNVYTEYMVVLGDDGFVFERIGSTEVNLDIAALTTSEVETIWSTTPALAS